MKIIKRNGKEVDFDGQKIVNAISKANQEVLDNDKLSNEQILDIAKDIENFANVSHHTLSVEDIQNEVEDHINELKKFKLGRAYSQYRFKRAMLRNKNTTDDVIMSLIDYENEKVKQENSNKNPRVISVQRDYMAGEVSKDLTRRFLLPEDIWKAHSDGIIHFHDADYFVQHANNCGLVDLADMLENGTVISDTKIDKPHTFSTACNIATQIEAQVASSQYGGQSMTFAHLAPFVNESRKRFRKQVEKDFIENGIELSEEKINAITENRVREDINRGVQIIQYQTITLQTTNGQAPFVTLFLYIDEVPEGQTRDDLVLVIEEVLKQRYQGVKNEKGAWITPAFPKLIYVLDEDNIYPDSKYYWLTELAAKCTSRRMVPDYISAKVMKELKNGNVYPVMGCVDGNEIITYKYDGFIFTESFRSLWNKLYDISKVRYQRGNSFNNYIDFELDNPAKLEVYDTKEGFVKVKRVIQNFSTKWIKVTLSNGYTLTCTNDHPFHTENRGRVFAEDLMYGDTVTVNNEKDPKKRHLSKDNTIVCSITMLEPFEKKDCSFDFTTESDHFEVSGIYSHNCRSALTVEDTVRNPDGTHKFYGRFNQGVVTINLVDVALSSGGNFEEFWKIFEERLELCHRALRCRHERLLGTVSDVAPILWQYGAYARLEKGETIDKLLYGGYSTISLGYAGLYECVKYMTGESHTSKTANKNNIVPYGFAIQVMQKMNDKCKEWKEKENISYSLYGTPLESTTYKFAKCLQKRFGIIKEVTDHNYITNSYHINVREKINAFEKLGFESDFQKLSPGGAISYVETPNLEKNIESVLSVMKYIYDNIMYAELNTKSDYCQVCGSTDEIKIIKDENGKLIWRCPHCGNTDQNKMNVARRTCGLTNSPRKIDEIAGNS